MKRFDDSLKKFLLCSTVIVIALLAVMFIYKEFTFKHNIEKNIPGIACWGDSLTYGVGGGNTSYPQVLQELMKEDGYDIPVYNLGVGGENTIQIMARKGVLPILTKSSFVIPASTTPVEVDLYIKTRNSQQPLEILLQGDAGIDTVEIASIEGTLSVEMEENCHKYYFTRLEAGNEVEVSADETITLNGDANYDYCIPVVFMGTNGLWSDPDNLIFQIDTMLRNQYSFSKERYLVIGLITGDQQSNKELEDALQKKYGKRYINLREYLVSEGLELANIEPNESDLEAIKNGKVPPSLKSDDVHLNSAGYQVFGELVYQRIKDLRYFNYFTSVK